MIRSAWIPLLLLASTSAASAQTLPGNPVAGGDRSDWSSTKKK